MDGKWFHLSSWLADNEVKVQERMDGIDSKIYKLRTETDKMGSMEARMDSNFERI